LDGGCEGADWAALLASCCVESDHEESSCWNLVEDSDEPSYLSLPKLGLGLCPQSSGTPVDLRLLLGDLTFLFEEGNNKPERDRLFCFLKVTQIPEDKRSKFGLELNPGCFGGGSKLNRTNPAFMKFTQGGAHLFDVVLSSMNPRSVAFRSL